MVHLIAAPVQPAKVEPVVAAATSVAAAPAAGAPVDAAKPASSAAQVAAPSEADKKPADRKAPAGREDSKISKADGAKKKEGDAKKKSKDKKDDDARRLADENVDEALEIAELEATKAHEENKDAFKELYSIFPQSVYTSYDKIKTFAREYVAIFCPRFFGSSCRIWDPCFKPSVHCFTVVSEDQTF